MTTTPDRRLVVGITGPMHSGKTTAAKVFKGIGFTRVRFAGPLKAMMKSLGLTDEQIDGDFKEVPCELLCGNTPRYAQQTIGTEWGRDMIGKSLWLNAWRAAIDKLPPHIPVVADDVRFSNEAKIIQDMGGWVFKIVRPDPDAAGDPSRPGGKPLHESERFAFNVDETVTNDKSLAEFEELFRRRALAIKREWSWVDAA